EFRDDLYYRLNVITINLPELKERQDDISLLANYFLKKYTKGENEKIKSISKEAMNLLLNHNWPGNVRELENVIERAIALGRYEEILPEDLPVNIRNSRMMSALKETLPENATIEELERDYITKILKKTKGHKINTARILGIDRRTLYRKLKKYSMEY
ncbi:MAG: helix-turn-helix domain-containing protein, partial [Pseudomonadota bacterium]